jgi:hypothetical protein
MWRSVRSQSRTKQPSEGDQEPGEFDVAFVTAVEFAVAGGREPLLTLPCALFA